MQDIYWHPEENFCYWCGYSSRNRKGHCIVCYPPGYSYYTYEQHLGHILHVRNKEIDPSILNSIRKDVQPYDISKNVRPVSSKANDINIVSDKEHIDNNNSSVYDVSISNSMRNLRSKLRRGGLVNDSRRIEAVNEAI